MMLEYKISSLYVDTLYYVVLGVDGAISDAGGKALARARQALPVLDNKQTRCPTGDAKITISGDLKARDYCIHAVGPNYRVRVYFLVCIISSLDCVISESLYFHFHELLSITTCSQIFHLYCYSPSYTSRAPEKRVMSS